jgi:hypothetical protein
MEVPRTQLAVKLLPSLTDVAFLMPIAFLFGRMDGLVTLLGDCDTGWHIRTGQWILAHRAVPFQDLFSYSKPGSPWYAWEWLSDVWFALLNGWGGLAAVALFAVLLLAVTFALVFRLARRHSSPWVAVAVTMLAATASSIHWLARPHLFTLLFTAVFCSVFDQVRGGRTRFAGIPWLALLPALTVLWTNLHGGFGVGIVLAAAFGAAELLEWAVAAGGDRTSASWAAARRYFACAGLCALASLINPYGWRLDQHVVAYLREPFQGEHIAEFLSVSFHHPIAIFFEAMLLVGAWAAFECARERRFAEALLFVVWAHAALLSARHIPLFAIIAAPMAARTLDRAIARLARARVAAGLRSAAAAFERISAETAAIDAVGRWHPASAAAVVTLALLLYAPHPPKRFRAEFDPDRYPAAAVAKLGGGAAARIFTFDQWGDYLIYRLYPGGRVFVDGRSDFYGAEFERRLMDALNVNPGWDKTLAGFGVDTVLMPPNAPLAGALKESGGWRVEYDDGVAIIFRMRERGAGPTVSAATGGGKSRDREVTKTQASDRSITEWKSKT